MSLEKQFTQELEKRNRAKAPKPKALSKHATTAAVSHVGELVITYHTTVIVQADQQKIRLNTGGWKTATTKKKMNEASQEYQLGFSVSQKSGKWLVSHKGETIPFFDGMELER